MTGSSGKYLGVSVGGTPIDGNHEWSVGEQADKLEATSGSDRGRGRKSVGVTDTVIRVKFYLDIAAGQMNFIRAGTDLTGLELFLDAEAPAPLYTISSATVFSANVVGQVRGQFIVDAEIEANGDVITVTDPG